jgi:hypothetical protein
MRAAAPTLWAALVAVLGAYIGMALRNGCVWLFFPTLRVLTRKENPAGYWAVLGAAALALTILVGIMAYALITL